jgi:cell division protein FtsQ
MKLFKIIASFLLVLGILVLLFWTGMKAKNRTCSDISILIHAQKESQLLTDSGILDILKRNDIAWKEVAIKEIEIASIYKILAQENYIKSVNKVHFLGSKLQIDVTLHDILLEVEPMNGKKFLLDVEGIYLPYSPKVNSDVIIVSGFIPNTFQNKERITQANKELYELFSAALLIKKDPFYATLFNKLYINEKQEIIFYPSVGKVPVLFGDIQDAENKLKALKYMYEDVFPYMNEDKYARLDVRFKNRIVATKTKS